jgi:hypothetical protein
MKKLIFSISIFSLIVTSCVDEANNYNLDHDRSYDVAAGVLLTNAQKELADQMTTPSVNLNVFRYFSQYWAATQYTTESKYRVTTRKIPDNHWTNLYRDVLGNLEAAKKVVASEVKPITTSDADWVIQQKNKLAIIEIQEVYTYQILVDTFGDIPYTDALNPDNVVLPTYDNDATIYPKLITRLNAAIANLDINGISFESGDYIYNGDVENWKLFGNSLKLKLGINIADVDNALAKSTVESAVLSGVITSNSKNAAFNYVTAAPNYNPIYANLIASGRNDFVPARTITQAMCKLDDPRKAAFFTNKVVTTLPTDGASSSIIDLQNISNGEISLTYKYVDGTALVASNIAYNGDDLYYKTNSQPTKILLGKVKNSQVLSGIADTYTVVVQTTLSELVLQDLWNAQTNTASTTNDKQISLDLEHYLGGKYGYSNAYTSFSHVSDNIKLADAAGVLMESTEVSFYLAEAAARGFEVGHTDEYFYNKAIHDSFDFWGLSSTDADNYLTNTAVAYSTAEGNWKQKIGSQAWIAYFNRGFESWSSWRRLDYPVLAAPANAYPEADGVVPKRYTYPVNEQTVNGANFQAAAAAIGGDKLATKIFWDVN